MRCLSVVCLQEVGRIQRPIDTAKTVGENMAHKVAPVARNVLQDPQAALSKIKAVAPGFTHEVK